MSRIIGDWEDLLGEAIMQAWPVAAEAVSDLNATLMGGTAIAIHLRHRKSTDLDYMVATRFSGERLAAHMADIGRAHNMRVRINRVESGYLSGEIETVPVQVLCDRNKAGTSMPACPIMSGLEVSGTVVGSQADLLAAKLDAIVDRSKARDYVDLAALDRLGQHNLEMGITFHHQRYGTAWNDPILEDIVFLLEDPGILEVDYLISSEWITDTLDYLHSRASSLRAHLAACSQSEHKSVAAEESSRVRHHRRSDWNRRQAPEAITPRRCGAWMPQARTYCCLDKGHNGHHRSS